LLPKDTGYEVCSPWPHSGGVYSTNTRLSPLRGPQKGDKIAWTFTNPNDSPFISTPVIAADGTIYTYNSYDVTQADCYLFAISPQGKLKWKAKISSKSQQTDYQNSKTFGIAIGKNGIVYVVGGDYILQAFSPNHNLGEDVQPLWVYGYTHLFLNENNICIGNNGTIYITISSNLIAIDSNQDHNKVKVKWSTNLFMGLSTTCVGIGKNGNIYIGVSSSTPGYYLYAYSPDQEGGNRDVKPLWTSILLSYSISYICIGDDDTIYCCGSNVEFGNENIYAFDPNPPDKNLNQPKWTYNIIPSDYTNTSISDYTNTSISYNKDNIYASNNLQLFKISSEGNGIRIYNTVNKDSIVTASCIGADGTIYIGTDKGNQINCFVHAIRPDGTPLWSKDLPDDTFSESQTLTGFSIGFDNTLYVSTIGTTIGITTPGKLYAIKDT